MFLIIIIFPSFFFLLVYLWDWFIPYAPCSQRERVGAIGDGGKWLCDMERYELMPKDKVCFFS